MIRIIWVLIGLNTAALLTFITAYFVLTQGRNEDTMEKGWTMILAGVGLVVILLAAVPLRLSQSKVSLVFSLFFAALPVLITIGVFVSKKLSSLKKPGTFATLYYKDKTQRSIAAAIENGDTALLKQLIRGQDLNIQGNKVWDWPGLNYLQFAVRRRSNPLSFPFSEEANDAAIRILIEHGSAATPALAEAMNYLSPKMLSLLFGAGADPNCRGFVNPDPLLFEVIGKNDNKADKAILLIENGADVNAKNGDGLTLMMFAAFSAGTHVQKADNWRLVDFLLEKAQADYRYATTKGISLAGIIRQIRHEAAENNITMPPAFDNVVAWLAHHGIETTPAPLTPAIGT